MPGPRIGQPPSAGSSSDGLPLSWTPMPGWLDGRRPWNTQGNSQSALVTTPDGATQFAAWWGELGRIMVAKRALPAGAWQTFSPYAQVSTAMPAVTAANDNHEFISLAVDGDGRVHLAGNMHNVALRYIVSAPNDITSWAAGTMVGTDEDSVSYPQFCRLPDGDVLFLYRNGGSGAGDTFLNRFDTATDTWTRVVKLFDGLGSTPASSFYAAHLVVSPKDGSLHLGGFWRGNGSVTYLNEDYTHLVSADQGATWTSIGGAALTTPIKRENSSVVMPTAQDSGLNGLSFDVDEDGHPHAALTLFDAARRSQVVHFWHDGSTWHTDFVTALSFHDSQRLAYPLNQLTHQPVIACGKKGRTVIVWRTHRDNGRGVIRATILDKNKAPVERVLARMETAGWEPTIDKTAVVSRNELHVLVSPAGELSADPEFAEFRGYGFGNGLQWGAILGGDIARLHEVNAGSTPRLVPHATTPIAAATVTSTSTVDVPGVQAHMVDPLVTRATDRLLLVRLRVRAKMDVAPNTATLTLVEGNDAGRIDRTMLQLDPTDPLALGVSGAAFATYVSPWMPLQVLQGDWRKGGTIRLQAKVSAGTLTISGGIIETALIMGPDQAPVGVARRAPVPVGPHAIPDLHMRWPADAWGTLLADNTTADTLANTAKDVDGFGNNLLRTQAGAPKLRRPILNGHNVIRFAGADGYNVRAGEVLYPPPDGFTMFAVIANLGGTGTRPFFHVGDSAAGGREMGVTSAGKPYLNIVGGSTVALGTSTVAAAGRVIVVTMDPDGNYVLTTDGNVEASGVSGVVFTDAAPVIFVGRRAAIANFFTGDWADGGFVPRALPAAERKALEASLGALYGVTITP